MAYSKQDFSAKNKCGWVSRISAKVRFGEGPRTFGYMSTIGRLLMSSKADITITNSTHGPSSEHYMGYMVIYLKTAGRLYCRGSKTRRLVIHERTVLLVSLFEIEMLHNLYRWLASSLSSTEMRRRCVDMAPDPDSRSVSRYFDMQKMMLMLNPTPPRFF